MKRLHSRAAKHLDEDIKGYQKQRKHLKKEIQEDKELKKKLKVSTNGKKACCDDCKRGKGCSGKNGQDAKKTRGIKRRGVQKRK
jgi:hypothetical protein